MERFRNRMRNACLLGVASLFLVAPSAAFAGEATAEITPVSLPTVNTSSIVDGLSTEAIVDQLMQRNAERAAALHGYRGKRIYHLKYEGFPSGKEAEMEIVARYEAPESKEFDVVAESGSKMVQTKVFAKLLEGEREASSPGLQHQVALTTDNYSFKLLGTRPSAYGGCYRLAVEPKRNNRYLYRGEICVNAADFAVESVDAEPAKNPSFWIKKTHIEHHYQKVGEFWLPASNKSVSNTRLGGTATLSIQYSDYELR